MLVKDRTCTGSSVRDVMLEMVVQEARDCRCPSGDSDVRTNVRTTVDQTFCDSALTRIYLLGLGEMFNAESPRPMSGQEIFMQKKLIKRRIVRNKFAEWESNGRGTSF